MSYSQKTQHEALLWTRIGVGIGISRIHEDLALPQIAIYPIAHGSLILQYPKKLFYIFFIYVLTFPSYPIMLAMRDND